MIDLDWEGEGLLEKLLPAYPWLGEPAAREAFAALAWRFSTARAINERIAYMAARLGRPSERVAVTSWDPPWTAELENTIPALADLWARHGRQPGGAPAAPRRVIGWGRDDKGFAAFALAFYAGTECGLSKRQVKAAFREMKCRTPARS